MEYPKINSLWKREGWYFDQDKKKSPDYQKGRQSFIIGDYAQPEFGNAIWWDVEEKIDGTNVRIRFSSTTHNGTTDPHCLELGFSGRTKVAQMPCHLLDYLQKTITKEKMLAVFPDKLNIILFGEGYGPKIQAAGPKYSDEVGFCLFDVWVTGWWLKREDVRKIAADLGLTTPTNLGLMDEGAIYEFVKSHPLSRFSKTPQIMEGIVARAAPLVLFRDQTPLMWKLKCKEFK